MRTLNGLRVLNTRPKNQGKELNELIIHAGGVAIEFPVLEIQQTPHLWLVKLPPLDQVAHAIFISANAVEHAFNQLHHNHISWPSKINVIAIGESTAKALRRHHVKVHEIPAIPDSENLLFLPSLQHIENKTVLLFKGEGGRPLIEEVLKRRKAHIVSLAVYQRGIPSISPQLIDSLWRENAVDIILLTSAQSIHNLFSIFDQEAHNWLKSKPCLVISERLAQIASLFGIKEIWISHPDKIMDALFDYKG